MFNHHAPQVCEDLHNYSQSIEKRRFESGSTEQPPINQNQVEEIFYTNFVRKWGYTDNPTTNLIDELLRSERMG